LDKGASLNPYVTRAVRIMRDSGLPDRLEPVETSVEGEWEWGLRSPLEGDYKRQRPF
jgi:uncharacterized protein YqgV (UPF0045/DUF77 family)